MFQSKLNTLNKMPLMSIEFAAKEYTAAIAEIHKNFIPFLT